MTMVQTLISNAHSSYVLSVIGLYVLSLILVFGLYRIFIYPVVADIRELVRGIRTGTIRRKPAARRAAH